MPKKVTMMPITLNLIWRCLSFIERLILKIWSLRSVCPIFSRRKCHRTYLTMKDPQTSIGTWQLLCRTTSYTQRAQSHCMVMGKELRQTTCLRGRKEGFNQGSNRWGTLNIHRINNHKGASVTLAQRRPISIIDIATIKEISKLSPLGLRSLTLPKPLIFWQTLKTRSISINSINSFCNQIKTKWGKESETKSLLGLVHFYQSATSISTKTISKQLSVPKTSFIKARLVDLLTQLATIRTIPRKWEVSEGETIGKVRPYPLKTSIN